MAAVDLPPGQELVAQFRGHVFERLPNRSFLRLGSTLAGPTLAQKPPGLGRTVDSDTFTAGWPATGGPTEDWAGADWAAAGGAGGAGRAAWGTATTLKAIDQRSPSPRNGANEWGCQAGNTKYSPAFGRT
jgi:hypothetical protein